MEMKIRLNFVPAGGGESDYSLEFDLPAIPQPGDYISIRRPIKSAKEVPGTCDFIVKRTRWWLDYPDNDLYKQADDDTHGNVTEIVVDCEFALGSWSSEEHKRAVAVYSSRGRGTLRHE
jgi:hypothetical protein